MLGSWVGVAAVTADDAALDRFFREYLEAEFRLRPTLATELGDHRFDDQLDDVSAAARARWPEATKAALAELPRRVEFSTLSPAGQVDYRILEHHLRYSLWMHEHFDPYVTDPRSYSGLLSGAVFGLLTQSTLPHEANVAHSIARIRQMSKVLEAARENLRHPPLAHLETAIQQNRGAIEFFESELLALAGRTKQRAELEAAAGALLPELRAHQQFLEHRTAFAGQRRVADRT